MYWANRHLMFIVSSVIVYSHGVSGTAWSHNNHASQVSRLLSSLLFIYLFIYCCCLSGILSGAQNKNAADCTCNWVAFFSDSFFTFLWHVCFLCQVTQSVTSVCVLIYVHVCQCLQRIWKRASGRWRGSCCSWRETWRLSPPLMTPTTCSSLKWLYPLHMHAFTPQSRGNIQLVYCNWQNWTNVRDVLVELEFKASTVALCCCTGWQKNRCVRASSATELVLKKRGPLKSLVHQTSN